jgi:hypothetical protein
MLLSRGKILSAMAGLAMLAMPVSAFAGHHHDDPRAERPFAPHDQGFHNGWFKHPAEVAAAPYARPFRPIYQPVREIRPAPIPVGWHEEEEEHEHEREQQWAPPPRYYGCDEDRDNCGQRDYRWRSDYPPQYQPNYRNDEDEDYGGEPYSWYMAPAPSAYNLPQRRAWLISRRQRAMYVIANLRSRGDSRGADRVVKRVVNPLTAQINSIDRQLRYGYGGYSYVPSDYGAPANYNGAPANSFLGALMSNSGYNGANAGYYGPNPGYAGAPNNNPAISAIGAMLAPMLGGLP